MSTGRKIWKNAWKIAVGIASALAIIFGSLKDAAHYVLQVGGATTNIDATVRVQVIIIGFGAACLGVLLWRVVRKPKQAADTTPIRREAVQEPSTPTQQLPISNPQPSAFALLNGEFSMFTDKDSYKVGETIHVTVKVISLMTLGTTTVRLIQPYGQGQKTMKIIPSHGSGTFPVDFPIDHSCTQGTWKIIAERGDRQVKREIEIV